ncbi:MAG: hypothetical protein V4555_19765 [Acidobacteriota bacterium]
MAFDSQKREVGLLITMNLLRLLGGLALLAGLSAASSALAQGGPPFRTDDPETPGNKHWEVNVGFLGERNPVAGSYQVPDFDFNYGLGDRIQLKYEIPIAIEELRTVRGTAATPAQPGNVMGGLGESLLGVKWRFYEHHPGERFSHNDFGTGLLGIKQRNKEALVEDPGSTSGNENTGEAAPGEGYNLNVSTYPQIFLDNPTNSVPRGVVDPGPNFYLPLEVNGRFGPVRYTAEVGYSFGNHNVPQTWNRGLVVGHEFTERTEVYVEIFDEQDANRVRTSQDVGESSLSKQRETTLDVGGRHSLNHRKTLTLLVMGGRSFQSIATSNSQPSWIAYVGLQILLGSRERTMRQVVQKVPDQSDLP